MGLRILQVELNGVKLLDQKVELSPLTVLLGLPGTGKSSVLTAIRLAALGYEPSRGKREADTAEVMRGDSLSVRVDLSDGRFFSRTLSRTGRSLKSEIRASWLPPTATNTAQAEAIRSLFGASDVEAAEHLDLRELLAASPNERAARIEALLAATAAKPEDQRAILGGLARCRLAGVDEDRLPADPDEPGFDDAVLGLSALLKPAVRNRISAALDPIGKEIAGGGVPAALVAANAKKREAASSVKQKTAARAEIENRALGAAAPAERLDALNAQRQKSSDRIAELRGAVERAETTKRAQRAAAEEAAKAEAVLKGHPARREAIEASRKGIAERAAQVKALVDPPSPLSPPIVVVDPAETQIADDLSLEAQALSTRADSLSAPAPTPPTPQAVPTTESRQDDVRRAEEAVERARTGPWTRVLSAAGQIEKRLRGTPQATACAAHLDEITKICEANGGGDLPACEKALSAAKRDLKAAEAKAKAVRQANAEADAVYQKFLAEWREKNDEVARIRAEAKEKADRAVKIREGASDVAAEKNAAVRNLYATSTSEHRAKIETNARARKRLMRENEIAQETIDRETAALASEEQAAAAARGKLDGTHAARPEDLSGAPAEIEALEREVDSIDQRKRAVEGADARVREMATLAAEIEAAGADLEIFTAAEWALQRIRERDVAARGGPLVERMRKFLGGAGLAHEPFLRATKGATEFGWIRDGNEVRVGAMGGGETALFMAALATAIIALRRPAMRVLLVEAAEAGDAGLATALLSGIEAMKDEIDTAVVATCVEPQIPLSWAVIEYSPKNATVAA